MAIKKGRNSHYIQLRGTGIPAVKDIRKRVPYQDATFLPTLDDLKITSFLS